MEAAADQTAPPTVAALDHLTGPSRGTVSWLAESAVDVVLTPNLRVRISETRPGPPRPGLVARLHRAGESYEIEAPEGQPLWVNRERITGRLLRHDDMIEFGETGPVSRFRIYGDAQPRRKSIPDILADCVGYLRASRQPLGRKLVRAAGELVRELTLATTLLFRALVLGALAAFGWLAWQQYQVNIQLQERIETGAARVESVAAAVARARDEALRPGDLNALREEIGDRVVSNIERLEALERRSRAAAQVIAESVRTVAFLQGSYGFREPESGRMLRHVVNPLGMPLISPRGQPLLTLEGDGPVAEINVIGTGFLVGTSGALVTNRHVALPWESDAGTAELEAGGLEPVMTRFIAYLPGLAEPIDVALRSASDSADLAVLALAAPPDSVAGLSLAETPPAAGDEVIVMGYPTGLRSMLAQSGAAFIEALQATEDTDFWSIAARLAAAGHIAPLASRGIVGHATGETIVYDAETTHGGSGGPVLDMEGRVIAVNTAILPEYGGSNIGVPAAKVRALLEEAGLM
jgi:S1-C subfamily serine protease